jgi:hypothetical protein
MRAPARYALLALLAVVATWGAGCITPSIPIPPPDADRMVFEAGPEAGTATFSYEGDPLFAFAIVYVYNRDTGSGVIGTADENGVVEPTEPFDAVLGHQIAVSFETEDEVVSTCVIFREGTPDGTQVCN